MNLHLPDYRVDAGHHESLENYSCFDSARITQNSARHCPDGANVRLKK